jgi:hypothetical protein|tara:strand:+ start:4221 stop:4373 length:153 start_codon:yes stop_codon:yes gene_type:complete
MYVKNYMNKIVKIDRDAFASEKQFYIALWKIKYNINLTENVPKFNIINFI